MNFVMTDTLNTLTFHDLNVFSLVNSHEDPQETFFCDQHDFLVATDALFSKGDKTISCCGNLISTLISGQKT